MGIHIGVNSNQMQTLPSTGVTKAAEWSGRESMDADCLDGVPGSTPCHHEILGKLLNCSVQRPLVYQMEITVVPIS